MANTPFGQATFIPRYDAGYDYYLDFPMEQLGLGLAQTSSADWDYVAQNPVIATMAKENNMEVGDRQVNCSGCSLLPKCWILLNNAN